MGANLPEDAQAANVSELDYVVQICALASVKFNTLQYLCVLHSLLCQYYYGTFLSGLLYIEGKISGECTCSIYYGQLNIYLINFYFRFSENYGHNIG